MPSSFCHKNKIGSEKGIFRHHGDLAGGQTTQGRLTSHHSHMREETGKDTRERRIKTSFRERETDEVRLNSCRMRNQIQHLRKWHPQPAKRSGSWCSKRRLRDKRGRQKRKIHTAWMLMCLRTKLTEG